MAGQIVLGLPLSDFHLILNALEFKQRELLRLAEVQVRNCGGHREQAVKLANRHRNQANECALAKERLKTAHTKAASFRSIYSGA